MPDAPRVALCVARFYEELADKLEAGAREALAEAVLAALKVREELGGRRARAGFSV